MIYFKVSTLTFIKYQSYVTNICNFATGTDIVKIMKPENN